MERNSKPLDILIKIAKYLESTGYMEKISIKKPSEKEATVEMHGVQSSSPRRNYSKKVSNLRTIDEHHVRSIKEALVQAD